MANSVMELLEHHAIRWITPAESDTYTFCPADIEILKQLKGEGVG